MSTQGGNSYNLRETTNRDERNWRAQMEQRMTAMAETYQNAIHEMRYAQNRRLAELAQSHERNMARILELMQQGNTGAVVRAPVRQGPNPSLAHIHGNHPVEEGADSREEETRGEEEGEGKERERKRAGERCRELEEGEHKVSCFVVVVEVGRCCCRSRHGGSAMKGSASMAERCEEEDGSDVSTAIDSSWVGVGSQP
ncbi:hypothetical protein Scep_015493 [Stephania cephalantha]|uniref:Uncharacterized protein n=1 Tax=Stephania cephalantha TaxID=152367 RepID=A0AAP0J5G0_9MAGN